MEDETVLREAISRRDMALAEARRLDEFVRLYNELRGRPRDSMSSGSQPAASESGSKGPAAAPISGEFSLDKGRPLSR